MREAARDRTLTQMKVTITKNAPHYEIGALFYKISKR
jgi:hypothetical protein